MQASNVIIIMVTLNCAVGDDYWPALQCICNPNEVYCRLSWLMAFFSSIPVTVAWENSWRYSWHHHWFPWEMKSWEQNVLVRFTTKMIDLGSLSLVEANFSLYTTNRALPIAGYWRIINMECLHLFLRCHVAGKRVLASQSVSCFPRPSLLL